MFLTVQIYYIYDKNSQKKYKSHTQVQNWFKSSLSIVIPYVFLCIFNYYNYVHLCKYKAWQKRLQSWNLNPFQNWKSINAGLSTLLLGMLTTISYPAHICPFSRVSLTPSWASGLYIYDVILILDFLEGPSPIVINCHIPLRPPPHWFKR